MNSSTLQQVNRHTVDHTPAPPSKGRGPVRSCAACRKTEDAPAAGRPQSEHEGANLERLKLVRWVRDAEGEVFPDLGKSAFGRGAWVHPSAECFEKLQPALSRSFRAPVMTTPEAARERLRAAANKQVRALLGSARRQKQLVYGTDAVSEVYRRGDAHALVVATDARAAASSDSVRDAAARGRAAAWGTKSSLGVILGRSEVGVIAVLEERLATALFGAIALAHLKAPPTTTRRVRTNRRADVSTEVE